MFTFPDGTVTMHSLHEDCKTVGLRIDTPFEVTGGTGAYSGAHGGGWELTGDNSPITWVGTISY